MWTPEQLVLQGTYCSPGQIYDELFALRQQLQAKQLALLSFDASTPFRSLCFCTHAAAHSSLRDQSFTRLGSELLICTSDSPEEELDEIFGPAELGRFQAFKPLAEMHSENPWLGVSDSAKGNLRCLLLVQDPTEPDWTAVAQHAVHRLTLMANGTLNVSVQHDNALMLGIDKIATSYDSGLEPPLGPRDAHELLKVLRDAIGAEAISWYGYSPDTGELEVRYTTPSRLVEPRSSMDARVKAYSDGLVPVPVIALERNRAVFRTDTANSFQFKKNVIQLQSVWSAVQRVSAVDRQERSPVEIFELAIPVPRSPLGRRFPLDGVLSVARIGAADSPPVGFDAYSLALARNAALRLALFADLHRSDKSNRDLADLASSAPQRRVQQLAATRVPSFLADFDGVHEQIQSLLGSLRDATRAASATLRLLAPSTGQIREEFGGIYSLHRYAADPVSLLLDSHNEIALSQQSVHAWVVRNGRICHLPDLSVLPQPDYPDLENPLLLRSSMSELCLPVFVDGRPVGSINLESPDRHAFDFSVGLASNYATAVSSRVSELRGAIAESTLSLSSQVYRETHTLFQLAEGIADKAANGDDSADVLSDAHKMISVILDGDDSGAPERRNSSPAAWILNHVISEIGLEFISHSIDETTEVVAGLHVRIVEEALRDVLSNVQKYMSRAPGSRAKVDGFVTKLAGRSHLDIRIRHLTRDPLPASLSQRLFRIPVALGIDGRPHLGSFTSGALLRSIGGDAFMRLGDEERSVEIVLSIPVQ